MLQTLQLEEQMKAPDTLPSLWLPENMIVKHKFKKLCK
jgi:hypothetical protein